MSWYKKTQTQYYCHTTAIYGANNKNCQERTSQNENLSKEELENYEFDAAEWGHSITPKDAFEKRKYDAEDMETLYDLASYDDEWRLNNALGKGWPENSWENVTPSTHLIPKIKNNELITIYRASRQGSILPGAYVTESKEYAIFHGEAILNGDYKLSATQVYPDELMTYGDPHEFIYIPRNLNMAHERLADNKSWYKKAQTYYSYKTNCVNVENGMCIQEMVDKEHEVSWEEFNQHVSNEEIERAIGPIYKNTPFKIQDDYAVSFHKSEFLGEPCYYLDHSRIEYIFTPLTTLFESTTPSLNAIFVGVSCLMK